MANITIHTEGALSRISLTMPALGDKIRADVGMQVAADVRTGRRSIMSYLFSPIDEAAQQAGRER